MAVIPKRIFILGQTFTVEFVDLNQQIYSQMHLPHATETSGLTALGTAEAVVQRLAIRDGQGFHQQRSTVIHEVLHVIERLTGHEIDDVTTPEGIARHSLISAFETAILDVLRSNPELVEWLRDREP